MIENKELGDTDQDISSGSGGSLEPAPADPALVGTSGLPMEPADEAVRRLEGEVDEARDRHLRLAAEFDNFRKRVTREREETGPRAQAQLVGRLLDVLDDLDRVSTGGAAATADVIQQALVLIDRKLRKELEGAGLERIDPVGQPFDPSQHEAVAVIPPASGQPDHSVAATYQAGYRFKGTLIRPARVQVYSSDGHA